MSYTALGNPIWSGQYRLQGGSKLFFRTTLYGVALIALIMFYYRMNWFPRPINTYAVQVVRFLAWFQIVVALVGGTAAVTKALLLDSSTRMIESYRMSPMSAFTVISGYLFGGTLRILLMFLGGVLLGAVFCGLGNLPPAQWLLGNLQLLIVSVAIWSIVVFVGVGPRKPANLTGLVILFGALSFMTMPIMPGIALFSQVYAVAHCREVMLDTLSPSGGVGISLGLAVVALVFWSTAASRRYRRPYLPALDVTMSLILLAYWMACFVVGMAEVQTLLPASFRGSGLDAEPRAALVGALFCPLLVAHLPVAATVNMRGRLLMGAEPYRRTDRWPPALAAGIASLMIVVLVAGVMAVGAREAGSWAKPHGLDTRAWGVVLVSLLLSLWTVTGFLKASYYTVGRSLFAAVFVLLLWAGPPLADGIRVAVLVHTQGVDPTIHAYSFLLGCSPFFSILAACQFPAYGVLPGLAVQAVVTVLALLLGRRAQRVFIHKRARMLEEEGRELDQPASSAKPLEPLTLLPQA